MPSGGPARPLGENRVLDSGGTPDCRTVASALAQKTARRESFAGPRRGGCCFSVAVYRNFKPRVLCIDDESAGCDFLRAILDESGDFLVETGTDAFAALDLARRFKPDVVMLDINMPGQDGFSVARQFREEPWLLHRPIIFYSGREDQAIPLSAGSGGPVEFLKKGGPINEIERAVRRHAGERLALYAASKAELLRLSSRRAP